jgi:hypothetical protein
LLVFDPVTARLAVPDVDEIGRALTITQLAWLCRQVAQ